MPGERRDPLASGWLALIPGLITLLVTLYRIGVPSFTRDEGATLLAVHRSYPEMLRMLGNVDVVHTAYYSLIWVVTRLAGSGEVALRLPSAVAMAVAAGGVTLLGQRLASGRAGLASGLVFAAFPSVSYFAEDAREYAIVAALTTVSAYLLVRALQAAVPATAGSAATAAHPRYGWLVGYAAVLALLGLANILSLLIIAAHAVTIAVWRRFYGGPGRPFVLRWLIGVAVALVVTSPVVAIATRQTHQVQWIKVPGFGAILGLVYLVGQRQAFLIVVVIIAIALAVAALTGGRARLRADWRPGLWGLAVALLAGTALAALTRTTVGWGVAIAALAIVVVAGLPVQSIQRTQAGHGYGIRAADRAVARLSRPGDALLTVRYWPLTWGGGVERGLAGIYPYGLSRLHDIGQAQAPVPSATLGGTFAPDSVVRQRMARVTRLWVASWSNVPSALPPGLGFTLERRLHTRSVWLWLYTRPHTAAAGQATATAGRPAG